MYRTSYSLLTLLLGAAACGGGDAGNLEAALETQPAVLVEAPAELLVGDGNLGGCGGAFEQSVMAVDLTSGEIQWDIRTPWGPGAPAIVDDTVIVVGRLVDTYPPSVIGLDLRTGAPRWQRFLDQDHAALIAESSTRVAVRSGADLLLVDADGGITRSDSPGAGSRPLHFGRHGQFAERLTGGLPAGLFDPFAPAGTPSDAITSVERDLLWSIAGDWYIGASGDEIRGLNLASGERWTRDDLPLDDVYLRVEEVVAGETETVLLLGANFGPNHRLVVIDTASGEHRFTLDGIRSAAPARGEILYDRRSTEVDDGLTREIFVVSATDPDVVLWDALSSGELGGYIGSTQDGHVFALSNGTGLRYVVVNEPDDAPPVLSARFGGYLGPGDNIVADDLVASIAPSGIAYRYRGGPDVSIETDSPVTGFAMRNGVLVIAYGRGDYPCD